MFTGLQSKGTAFYTSDASNLHKMRETRHHLFSLQFTAGTPEERLYMKMLCRPLHVRPTPPENANTTAVIVKIQYNVIQILAFVSSRLLLCSEVVLMIVK